jgi:hypothetical protein
LGMLNFYRRFLPQAAATQAPLHDVLSGPRFKGSHPIDWTPELHKDVYFGCCIKADKKRLVTFPVLLRLLVTRLSSCFLDTGLGNLWEVPVEGSHIRYNYRDISHSQTPWRAYKPRISYRGMNSMNITFLFTVIKITFLISYLQAYGYKLSFQQNIVLENILI